MARKSKKILSKNFILALTLVLFVALIAYLVFHKKDNQIIPSANPTTIHKSTKSTGDLPISSNQNASSSSNAPSNSGSKGGNVTSNTNTGNGPLAPYGNFVSSHHPGGDNSTKMESVCNTSPGASCYIKFTNGVQTKQLGPQITDSNGATFWIWDIKSAGLSSGSWTVSAISTLNGQTNTAADSQPLTVQ